MKSDDYVYIIGPGENVGSGRIGGVTVPFDEFVNWSRQRYSDKGIKIEAHSLTGGGFVSILFSYMSAVGLLLNPRKQGIFVFHLTWRAMVFLSIPILLGARLFSKKIFIRKFAGDFDKRYEASSLFVKLLLRLGCTSCQCVFFETDYLVEWARKNRFSCDWWPNSRSLQIPKGNIRIKPYADVRTPRQRIIFLGRVSRGKGVDKLIDLAPLGCGDFEIGVFGPVDDDSLIAGMATKPGHPIYYGGVLNRDGVKACLEAADLLILPTTYTSEGYPGVIIEAAEAGLPTIVSSSSRGPSELVEKIGFGWVVDFSDLNRVVDLLRVLRTTPVDPDAIRQGVEEFDSNIVFEKVYKKILEVDLC